MRSPTISAISCGRSQHRSRSGLVTDEPEGEADQDRGKVVRRGRYVVFQMVEVAIARQMFQEILRLTAELQPQPPPAPA
jgi:hypothetical protein